MPPDWKKCTWASISPGVIQRPETSMTAAPVGISVEARAPTARTRPCSTTSTASAIAGRPVPSHSVAPTYAVAVGVAGGDGSRGVVPPQAVTISAAMANARVLLIAGTLDQEARSVGRDRRSLDARH